MNGNGISHRRLEVGSLTVRRPSAGLLSPAGTTKTLLPAEVRVEETDTQPARPKSLDAETGSVQSNEKVSAFWRPRVLAMAAAVLIAAAIGGTYYHGYATSYESTDDAFIAGHVVAISPKVASYVGRVHIDDNQRVQAGDLLVELDPRDFEAKLAQARANLAAAEAEAIRAHADARRYDQLFQDKGVSQQDKDNAVAKDRTAVAQTAQFEAAVRQAELNLSYTKIVAPEAGRITRKSVEPGDYVQVGQALFSIVPERVWVVANFKETQLDHMGPGQPVEIKVDAYPEKTFKGHVDSVQAGSGAAFSLLPPENATGNYVKVVQRVPVKILIDEPPDPTHVLGPGMSVVPTVKVK